MHRPIVAILVAAALSCAPRARAEKPVREPAPTTDPDPSPNAGDTHRFSVATLGGIGAGAGAALLIGAALTGHATTELYVPLTQGPTAAGACQPCTSSETAPIKAYYYTGIALMGVGTALAVADIALAVIDRKYRNEQNPRRVSIAPGALRVRF